MLNFGLLTAQIQEDRGQKLRKRKPLALQASVKIHKTHTQTPTPSIKDAPYLFLQRIQNVTESQGIWTVKMALCFNSA